MLVVLRVNVFCEENKLDFFTSYPNDTFQKFSFISISNRVQEEKKSGQRQIGHKYKTECIVMHSNTTRTEIYQAIFMQVMHLHININTMM